MKPEERLHVAVADFLRVALVPPTFWTSIDHGAGKLSKRAAGMAKARGVKAGLPDIWVIHPAGGRCIVIGIELKSATGRLSPVQLQRSHDLMTAGAHWRIARSIDDVHEALLANGVPVRASLQARAA